MKQKSKGVNQTHIKAIKLESLKRGLIYGILLGGILLGGIILFLEIGLK